MDFVIFNFPKEVCDLWEGDFWYLEVILKRIFHIHRIGTLSKVQIQRIIVKKHKTCQLFLHFNKIEDNTKKKFTIECLKKQFIDREGTYTLCLQPFKNIQVGDICLFNNEPIKKHIPKFMDLINVDGDSEEPLHERLDKFLTDFNLTLNKPWEGRIVRFTSWAVYAISLKSSTEEGEEQEIHLRGGNEFQHITCEGLPAYDLY